MWVLTNPTLIPSTEAVSATETVLPEPEDQHFALAARQSAQRDQHAVTVRQVTLHVRLGLIPAVQGCSFEDPAASLTAQLVDHPPPQVGARMVYLPGRNCPPRPGEDLCHGVLSHDRVARQQKRHADKPMLLVEEHSLCRRQQGSTRPVSHVRPWHDHEP